MTLMIRLIHRELAVQWCVAFLTLGATDSQRLTYSVLVAWDCRVRSMDGEGCCSVGAGVFFWGVLMRSSVRAWRGDVKLAPRSAPASRRDAQLCRYGGGGGALAWSLSALGGLRDAMEHVRGGGISRPADCKHTPRLI